MTQPGEHDSVGARIHRWEGECIELSPGPAAPNDEPHQASVLIKPVGAAVEMTIYADSPMTTTIILSEDQAAYVGRWFGGAR